MKSSNVLKKYEITQCALYKCKSKRRLEKLLLLEQGAIKNINNIINYHSFEIDKKGSMEKRKILAPDKNLKIIQKRILSLLQRVVRPEWLISGEKGKCYIDNGKAHKNANCVLSVDIRKFYDNCTREYVYQFFIDKLKTSADVAKVLTDIVTYDDRIPTGCPTSQIVAFYAYMDMFVEIYNLAKMSGCNFTLYVDDMTFSSLEPFSPNHLKQGIDCILRKYGHRPKYSKVKYYGAKDFKIITGTVVTADNTLVVPNGLQKKIYDTFQDVKMFTCDEVASSSEKTQKVLALKGQIQAARNIEEGKFSEITRVINGIKIKCS